MYCGHFTAKLPGQALLHISSQLSLISSSFSSYHRFIIHILLLMHVLGIVVIYRTLNFAVSVCFAVLYVLRLKVTTCRYGQ